jgi:hypothetical protein
VSPYRKFVYHDSIVPQVASVARIRLGTGGDAHLYTPAKRGKGKNWNGKNQMLNSSPLASRMSVAK